MEWKDFYKKRKFKIETEDRIFKIYIDLRYGIDVKDNPTIKGEIISLEEFDGIAIEFLAKQKLKFLYVLGGEKEKLFVTKMVKSYLKNNDFNLEEEQKINKAYHNFNAVKTDTHSSSRN